MPWQDTRYFYILLVLFFLVINFLTPFNGDDYTYGFNFADKTRIMSISDVFESQYVHYLTSNGRTIPHLLEQFFSGITGKWLFNILNSFMLVVLIRMIINVIKVVSPALAEQKFLSLNLVFLSVLFLLSYPGQSMLWMAGGLNYLWPTVFALIGLKWFESSKKYNLYLIGSCCVLLAWCQEAISIPFCASLWFLLLIDKSKRTTKNLVITLGFTLGTLLIVFAPGTMARLSSNEVKFQGGILYLLFSKVLETFACLRGLPIYWTSLILLIAFVVTKNYSTLRPLLSLIVLWVMNSLFFLALGFNQERITLFLSVISLILTIALLSQFKITQKVIRIKFLPAFFFALSLCSSYYVIRTCYDYKQWNNGMVNAITMNNHDRIVLRMNKYKEQSRFIYAELLNKDADSGHNRGFSLYFGKKSIQFIDEDWYDSIHQWKQHRIILKTSHSTDGHYLLHDLGDMLYVKLPIACFHDGINVQTRHEIRNTDLAEHQLFIRGVLGTLDDGTSRLEHYLFLDGEDTCECFLPKVSSNEDSIVILNKRHKMPICVFNIN